MADSPDIIVVGAGIVGCAVTYELARRGASVELVDDRPAGMGATQASAGVLAPFIEAAEGGPLLDLTARALEFWDPFVARLCTDSGGPVLYRRTGSLDVGCDETSFARRRATAEHLRARGVAVEIVDSAAARRLEPALTEHVVGGLLIAAHGFVAAPEFTRALATAARRFGARIVEHGRVSRIDRSDSEFIVTTERGSLTADLVVVAAGSWSGRIVIDDLAPLPVHPVRGQLLRLSWSGPPLARVLWSDDCYLVPWDDGTLLVGATVEDAGFDESNTAAGVRGLIDAATALVPRAQSAGFLGARAGLRPGTPDGLPIIGQSARVPNLWYATGHYRNGVLLAPLTASLVADAVLTDVVDPALAITSPGRFGML